MFVDMTFFVVSVTYVFSREIYRNNDNNKKEEKSLGGIRLLILIQSFYCKRIYRVWLRLWLCTHIQHRKLAKLSLIASNYQLQVE